MININKIILTTILSLGSLTMALAQSHSGESVVARDTVIYVTPEQLEDGVRSVAQAIVDSRKAQKVEPSKDILTKENVQLLKYQMLLSALGMNLAPTRPQQVQQIPSNVANNNSNVDARLDRLENMLYQLLQNQGANNSRTTISTPFRDNRRGTTIILSKKKKSKKDYSLDTCDKDCSDSCFSCKGCEGSDSPKSCISSKKLDNDVDCIEIDSITAANIVNNGSDNTRNIITSDTVTLIMPVTADFKRQVFFVLGGDILTPDAKTTLDNVVTILNQYPELSLAVVGYASVDGNRDYNLRLSAKRASKVFDYIVSKGISPTRIYAENGGVDAKASIISTARRVDIVAVNNMIE